MTGAWYVVGTNPRCEKRAEMSLREAGLDSFMPFETKWAKSGRQMYRAQRPLFVGYVFVFIPGEEGKRNFHAARGCDGVERLIGIQGHPSPVKTSEVHKLRQAQLLGAFDDTIEPEQPFKADDQIKVRLGKFTDWPGKVLGMTKDGRVKVLLSMFGKDHKHELAVDALEAA